MKKKIFFAKGNFQIAIAMKTKNFLNLFTGYPTNKEKVRKRPGGRPEGKNKRLHLFYFCVIRTRQKE